MPDMTIPANNGGNNSVAISMKIVSEVAAVVNAIGNIARPIRPIRTAAVNERVDQMIPMRRDAIVISPYFPAGPKAAIAPSACCTPSINVGVAIPKKSKKPGIPLRLSITAPGPPACRTPPTKTTAKAAIMMMPCMKSETLSAKNPPMNV